MTRFSTYFHTQTATKISQQCLQLLKSSRSILVLAVALTLIVPTIVSFWPQIDQIALAGGGPVTPPVSPSPSASPSPTPSPVSGPVPPVATPSAEVSSTGTSAPSNGGGSASPQTCTENAPTAPQILEVKRVSSTSVKISWTASELATDYTISYGKKSGEYIYGVPNTTNQTSFTISFLEPSQQYFFRVIALRGCAPSSPSNEVSTQSFALTDPKSSQDLGYVLGETNNKDEAIEPSPIASASPTPASSPSEIPETEVKNEQGQINYFKWILGGSLLLLLLLILLRFFRSRFK